MSPTLRSGVFRVILHFALLAAFSTIAQAQDQHLVGMLTDQLGVSQDQAAGGAGSIFSYAKDKLSADEFEQIARGVPDMNELLASAPESGSDSTLGKVGGMLGEDSSAGGLASLTSSFESIGLDADMVSKFMPIVNQYVGEVSGEQALGLLKGLF